MLQNRLFCIFIILMSVFVMFAVFVFYAIKLVVTDASVTAYNIAYGQNIPILKSLWNTKKSVMRSDDDSDFWNHS